MTMKEYTFGDYLIDVVGNHVTIRRQDDQPPQPTFYEMQHIKGLAFGSAAVVVEVFPRNADLIDGQNQRHLWCVDPQAVPNLASGHLVEVDPRQWYDI